MNAVAAAIEGERPRNIAMQLEALLFSTNTPLTPNELAKAIGVTTDEVVAAIKALEASITERPTSISLWTRPKGGETAYILDVKTPYRRDVAVLAPPALRGALIETLALIALNQPIPQGRLVRERGSTVYEHVKELMELGYVSKQRKGINFFLRTTDSFAAEFGLKNEPEMIRQALARAAGLARDPGAVTSDRVWVDGTAPPAVQTSAIEADQAAAAEEAARAQAEAAAKAAAEAEAAAKAEAEARAAAEAEAAAKAAAEAEAARAAAARAAEAEAARAAAAEAEAAARLAQEAARAPQEDCVVTGEEPIRPSFADIGGEPVDTNGKKKGRRAPAPKPNEPDLIRDALEGFGFGTEVAW
jgi:chromosome segregation and condensation protein ScpB